MGRLVAIALLVGCYDPTVQAGLPCGEGGACPRGLVCAPTGTCEVDSTDGGAPDGGTTACTQDDDCDGGCHELTGTCFAPGQTLYAAPMGTGTACMRMAPCNLVEAVRQISTNRTAIVLAPGTYDDALMLTASVVISGPSTDPAEATISGANTAVVVSDGVTAVIEGVTLRSEKDGIETRGTTTLARVAIRETRDNGAVLRGGTLRVLDSHVLDARTSGVLADTGVLEVDRTVITGNAAYGIRITGAGFSITSTIIADNGTMASGAGGGVRIAGTASDTSVFRFNTVARNSVGGFGTAAAGIECDRPAVIESSIIAFNTTFFAPQIGPECTAEDSLFDSGGGPGNLRGDPMFVGASDYHLQPGSPARDAADGTPPARDIDGEPRPSGEAADIGADELP